MKLTERLGWMKPSATLAINARAKELQSQGVDVLSFAAGEPDFPTPEHIRRAASEAIEAGHTRYTAVPGDPELRAEIAKGFGSRTGVAVKPSQVVVCCGAKPAIAHFFQAVLDPGDQVIVPTPCWVSYPSQIRIAGGEPLFVKTEPEQGFRLGADALRRAVGPRVKALVLNAPCNPTGAGIDEDTLRALAEVVIERDLWVLSDEIYWRVTFDGFEQRSIVAVRPELADRTLVIDGTSKTYSMTGWRIGWGIGPTKLVETISTLQGESTSCAPAFGQRAALAALRGDHGFFDAWLSDLVARRNAVVRGLGAMDGVRCRPPDGTFYAMADVSALLGRRPRGGQPLADSLAVASYLLDEARVAVVPGEPFMAPGFVRLSFACSLATVEKGLMRIGDALSKLV